MYYNINGIPTQEPVGNCFWIQKRNEFFFFKGGDISSHLDLLCANLQTRLAIKLFGDISTYNSLLPNIKFWTIYGGIDSDINISREDFEKKLNTNKSPELHKLLYLYDCRNLISTLQNAIIEIKYLLGQFYVVLNENDFLIHSPINPNGLQFASGIIVTNLTSIINQIFINLYSQLDFITKIHYEFENLATDFSNYPKIKAKNILFGDSKKLKANRMPGTLFEDSPSVNMIMTLRNEIVHNSSFDYMPKVFQLFQNGVLIEKYILLPDLSQGRLETFKNRGRFFSFDTKLNETLPTIVFEFWNRLKITLEHIQ